MSFSDLSWLVCFIILLCSPESPGTWESNKKENAITSIQSAGHEGCAAEQDKKSEGRPLRASANEQKPTAEGT